MPKIAKVIVIAWSLFMLLATVQTVYWQLVDDNPPVELHSLSINGQGELCLGFTKYTDALPEMRVSYISDDAGVSYIRETHPTTLSPGMYSRCIFIDVSDIPSGQYRILLSLSYQINPMKMRTVSAEIEDVIVP